MWLAAADTSGLDVALVTAVWAFLGIVVTTLGTIAVQALRSRRESATASTQPVNGNGNGNSTALIQIARDQGVLHQRADDSDERDDWQDKRLERLERWAEHHDPEWRG